MSFRCLFHVHSRYSYDSLLSPRKILARARQLDARVLIVTDHNTLGGANALQALANGSQTMVVKAAEYQSEKGDIIGLFLKEEVRSRISAEIIEEIHTQGGITVLPHPYKAHKLDDELLAGMDLIEIHNARCTEAENRQAEELCKRWGRPSLVGPDAHCGAELGAALNEFMAEPPASEVQFREQLLTCPRTFDLQKISTFYRPYSQMVKAVKTRSPRLFFYQAKRMVTALARSGE